jgi:glycosyltransferase involved in cell wall biosynthesis
VVDTTRPAAIADAIAGVLADPAEARAMGQRGAHAVAERHRWQISAGILLGVYAELRPPT